jgi:anti-sigma regulatory factor (Ser/Thr protein kinase)
MAVAVGIALRPLAGEVECGDQCEVLPWSRGVVLAMADGLGHGPLAARASGAFVQCVGGAVTLPLDEILTRAHRALQKTRGAVAAIARFDEESGSVEVAGVGNIAVSIHRQGSLRTSRPLLIAGVLGSAFRTPRVETFPMELGDLLIMHSDGVRSRWGLDSLWGLPARDAARLVLDTQSKGTDDAACAVARVVARPRSDSLPVAVAAEGDVARAVPVRMQGDPECVAHEARAFTQQAGFGQHAAWEVSIAASELATNVLKYGGSGELRLLHRTRPEEMIVVEAVDRGAPAQGSAQAARLGLGEGLRAVRRLMDQVDVEDRSGRGMRVVARKFRTPRTPTHKILM